MLRGTRVLIGEDARRYVAMVDGFRRLVHCGKVSRDSPARHLGSRHVSGQDRCREGDPVDFPDRKNRNVCLVPEATGMVQELWQRDWSRRMSKPARLFYVARCYRYERPQRGRYREFTQFGIEMLGAPRETSRAETVGLLRSCLDATKSTTSSRTAFGARSATTSRTASRRSAHPSVPRSRWQGRPIRKGSAGRWASTGCCWHDTETECGARLFQTRPASVLRYSTSVALSDAPESIVATSECSQGTNSPRPRNDERRQSPYAISLLTAGRYCASKLLHLVGDPAVECLPNGVCLMAVVSSMRSARV